MKKTPKPSTVTDDRNARLKQALKANIARRKAQMAARSTPIAPGDAPLQAAVPHADAQETGARADGQETGSQDIGPQSNGPKAGGAQVGSDES